MSERYSRQNLIPDWDQDKIKQAKVLILGVGATGSFLATNLALSGVGHLVLVDYDSVELSNLNRQLLFRAEDIGKNKAEVAKIQLESLNEDISITAFPKKMQELSSKELEGITVIACCLDTFRGRRWANSLALREKTVMVNGGMYAFMGDVQTIIPYQSACFECQPLVSQEKLSQACSPLGKERKKDRKEKEEVTLPSVSTLSSIIAGLMSQEVLKTILNIGLPLNNYLFYDGLSNSFTTIELTRNPSCPICGMDSKMAKIEALAFANETVGEFKQRIALAFGMADPQLMLKGKFLQEEDELVCNEGDLIFAIDERLASPMKISITFSSTEQSS